MLVPKPNTLEYSTEKGKGATEGTVNSQLRLQLTVPAASDGSYETALASILVEILDEKGEPAQFGGKPGGPMPMRPTIEMGVWEFTGSMPSAPGIYHTRFTLTGLADPSNVSTIVIKEPQLRSVAESGTPLRSGYIFSRESDLWVLSGDASRQRRITFFTPPSEAASEPAWSPDGETVAFTYLPPTYTGMLPATEIWTVKPDGSEVKPLLKGGENETLSRAAWSADGSYLYYAVEDLPDLRPEVTELSLLQKRRVDRLDVRTGERSQVVPSARMPSSDGPGGDLLYLEDVVSPDAGVTSQRIVRSSPDGSRRSVLVGGEAFQSVYGPRMSPDGKWVVFSALNAPDPESGGFDPLRWLLLDLKVASAHVLPWDVYLVPATGGEVVRLTELKEDQPHPIWLNNEMIAFMGERGLYKLRIDSAGKPVGQPETIHPGILYSVLTWYEPRP